MASQTDLDQGGTNRQFVKRWMGPTVGWVWVPDETILPVTAAGTTVVQLGTSLVPVDANVAGVIVQLPSVALPDVPATILPMPYALLPITVYDAGGHAATHNITITPAAGETIMGLASITIIAAYGGWALKPVPEELTWVTISG